MQISAKTKQLVLQRHVNNSPSKTCSILAKKFRQNTEHQKKCLRNEITIP